MRSGEAVTFTTWGPTLAAARTSVLPFSDSLREGGKGSFSRDCYRGQGAQGRSSSAAGKWSVYCSSRKGTAESCPHLTGMSRRAFTPVGSRKCGKRHWKEDNNCYSRPSPPGGVSCRGVGMVASLCRGQPLWECLTLNISICLAGFAGVLGERGFWSQWGGSGPSIPVPLLGLCWDAG